MSKKSKTTTVSSRKKPVAKKSKGKLILKLLLLAAVIGLCILPAVFVGGAYGYIPLIAVLFTLLISLIYALVLKRSLAYLELSELSSCLRGTSMDFIVEVRNRSFLVFPRVEASFYISDIFGEIDSITTSSLTLAPNETREFRFAVKFAHIGTYTAGLQELKVYDMLNLFCFTIHNNHRCEVNVNPRVHPFLNINISETAIYESLRSWVVAPTQGMDYAGCREYVFGDPIKSIHWKLSAHSRVYMTKILESYGTSDISVIMDLTCPAGYDTETIMDVFDGLVETSLSVCYFAHENGMDYDLRYFNKEGERKQYVTKDFLNTQELMDQLPAITIDNGHHDATPLLKEDGRNAFGRSNIIFCTAYINDGMCESLLELKREGRNVIVFFIIPNNVYDKAREKILAPLKRLENARITYYVCAAADDLAV